MKSKRSGSKRYWYKFIILMKEACDLCVLRSAVYSRETTEQFTILVRESRGPRSSVPRALRALRACLSADTELDKENCAVAVVGKDQKFKLCSQGEVEEYLSVFADEDGGDDGGDAGGATRGGG